LTFCGSSIAIRQPVLSIWNSLVETYIIYPKDNKTPEKAVLVLSDIFGVYTNSQLLADDYAANGYLAIVPDLFHGDAVKFSDVAAGDFNIQTWLLNHSTAKIDPIVEAMIIYLRQELGVKRIGATGYCFGAKVSQVKAVS
jgi:dienelactone hydrolase